MKPYPHQKHFWEDLSDPTIRKRVILFPRRCGKTFMRQEYLERLRKQSYEPNPRT